METSIGPEMEDINAVNEAAAPAEKPKEDSSSEDLASLKEHPGWIEIEDYLNAAILQIETIDLDMRDVRGVGYQTIITGVVVEYLETIKSLVDENYDYQQERTREGDSEGEDE